MVGALHPAVSGPMLSCDKEATQSFINTTPETTIVKDTSTSYTCSFTNSPMIPVSYCFSSSLLYCYKGVNISLFPSKDNPKLRLATQPPAGTPEI